MSTRTEKFNREMQRELGIIFQSKTYDWFQGALVSVSEVVSSPDLSYVKAYLSVLNSKNKVDLLQLINDNNKLIRRELAIKIKNSVRIIPELSFFEDTSLEKVEKFESIFEKLKNERINRGQKD